MALIYRERELKASELHDPLNHHFWLVGTQLFHRHKGVTAEMKLMELVPITFARSMTGALQAKQIKEKHAFVAIRLKKNVGKVDNIYVRPGTVVVLHKGMRFMYRGQPPKEVQLAHTLAAERKTNTDWLYEDRSAFGSN